MSHEAEGGGASVSPSGLTRRAATPQASRLKPQASRKNHFPLRHRQRLRYTGVVGEGIMGSRQEKKALG